MGAQSPHPPSTSSGQAKPLPKGEGAKPASATQRHTAWDFGELPELMEIRQGQQTLIGFPALVDDGDAVRIEVFDEPDLRRAATAKACGACLHCRSGTR